MPSRWKRAEGLVVAGHLTLALQDVDLNAEVWLSAAVEKIWLFLVGMVVLRSMSLVQTPPMSLNAQATAG